MDKSYRQLVNKPITLGEHKMNMAKAVILDTPSQLNLFHLLQLRGALKMELLGMRHSRGSIYACIKKELGFKGNKLKVMIQLEQFIEDNGHSLSTKYGVE